jgi:hypothetical protein
MIESDPHRTSEALSFQREIGAALMEHEKERLPSPARMSREDRARLAAAVCLFNGLVQCWQL